MARMRKCPFCGKEVKDGIPYIDFNELMGEWVFDHHCEHPENRLNVTITVYGLTEQEVIDKLNGVYEEQTSESL